MRVISIAAAIASLVSTAASAARDLPPELRARLLAPTEQVRLGHPTVHIPMRGVDRNGYYKCPYFQVYVNGKGPFTFLFDTGSSYTMVSDRVLSVAKVPIVFDRGGARDIVELKNVDIGEVHLANLLAVHDDNFGVDGVFGFRAFGSSNILFDLSQRDLVVSQSRIDLPGSFELAFDAPQNVPRIPVHIGSRTIPLLIDTGDDAYGLELRRSELDDAAIEHPPVPATTVLNGAKDQATYVTTLRGYVAVGPVRARNGVIAVNDDLPIGDLGYDVLRQFRIEFDPTRSVVTLQPIANGGEFKIPAQRSIGFTASFSDGRVHTVVPDSAAAMVGLVSADHIISVNGQPFTSLTPRTWDELLRTHSDVRVKWDHLGRQHLGRMPVVDLH